MFSLGLFMSCKKDPKLTEPVKAEIVFTNDVKINITNVADNTIIQIARDTAYTATTPKYITANNDTFSVSILKYYISNIKLKRPNGSYYVEKNSYRIIDAADTNNSCKFILKDVPLDNYIAMEFTIGIDSTRNCSGAQSGALDPIHDMFWSWNQGYIFYKFEGFTSSLPNFGFHNISYHIGGFLPPYNLIRTVNIPFITTALNVDQEHVSTIYMKANILEVFRGPLTISFTTIPSATTGKTAQFIANNYTDMFSVSAIKH